MSLIMYIDVAILPEECDFVWDQAKRDRILAKHGLDLVLGIHMFDGRPAISYPS